MKKVVETIAIAGIAVLLLVGCAAGIKDPLSPAELKSVANSVEKPKAFTKLSKGSSSDFEEAYGDQERLDPSFENTSDECSAVADLERVARWAAGGNDYRKFMPSSLRNFEDIDGWRWSIESPDDADEYSYAYVEVGLLTFESEEEALDFSALISENVEECFDFREDSDDFLSAKELSRFAISEEHDPDFSYEYTQYFETSGYFDISLTTEYAIGVFHFGPNIALVLAASDDDSRANLGITTSDLVDGFDDLRSLIEIAIKEAQESGATNS